MDNDVEYIVMGNGLGFQKKTGETDYKEKIGKDLCLGKSGDSGQMDSCLCRFALMVKCRSF